jgi:hypothetical protein
MQKLGFGLRPWRWPIFLFLTVIFNPKIFLFPVSSAQFNGDILSIGAAQRIISALCLFISVCFAAAPVLLVQLFIRHSL